MCNLYRMTRPADEVARLFGIGGAAPSNAGEEVFPGYPGWVTDGATLCTMTWGFPLQRTGAKGQPLKPKPVNNTRSDKLGSAFWLCSFVSRRCLIPMTAFAEAEGPKGAKTRTWFHLPDAEVFCAGGIWRDSAEWGSVFSMVMTDACATIGQTHDRMPVLIAGDDYSRWLDGSPDEAFGLCRPWSRTILAQRTAEPWNASR